MPIKVFHTYAGFFSLMDAKMFLVYTIITSQTSQNIANVGFNLAPLCNNLEQQGGYHIQVKKNEGINRFKIKSPNLKISQDTDINISDLM